MIWLDIFSILCWIGTLILCLIQDEISKVDYILAWGLALLGLISNTLEHLI